jgi:hypothetical protein
MKRYKIAILWRGDRAARAAATPNNNRYHRIFAELEALGIDAEAAVYAEDMIDEVRTQLMKVDGVLVWVNRWMMAVPVRSSIRCCAKWRQRGRGSARIPT